MVHFQLPVLRHQPIGMPKHTVFDDHWLGDVNNAMAND